MIIEKARKIFSILVDNEPIINKFINDATNIILDYQMVLTAGNGGSMAQAQHFAAELAGRYKKTDTGIFPAIALGSDTAIISALANDFDYANIFKFQYLAYKQYSPTLVLYTTSGESKNIIRLLEAQELEDNNNTILFTKQTAPEHVKSLAKLCYAVPSEDTATIQEIHFIISHLICEKLSEYR